MEALQEKRFSRSSDGGHPCAWRARRRRSRELPAPPALQESRPSAPPIAGLVKPQSQGPSARGAEGFSSMAGPAHEQCKPIRRPTQDKACECWGARRGCAALQVGQKSRSATCGAPSAFVAACGCGRRNRQYGACRAAARGSRHVAAAAWAPCGARRCGCDGAAGGLGGSPR